MHYYHYEEADSESKLQHEEDFTISKEIACYFYQSLHNLNDTENISLNLKYEAAIYQCVRAGNLTKLKERLNSSSGQFYYSYFCDIPHKKAQCHYIANVALISHYAIAGGLTTSIAYALCETYVHVAEACETPDELWHYFTMAAFDFTQRVSNSRLQSISSYPILQSTVYISRHKFDSITLSDVAQYCNITESYLSTLFKKEIGVNFSTYVKHKKTKVAAKLLSETDYPIAEIADFLSYSSSSAFGNQFRSVYGSTPSAYRLKNRSYETVVDAETK